jgi:hypothetical protein
MLDMDFSPSLSVARHGCKFVFTYYSQSCRVYQGQAAEALVGDPNANNKFLGLE